MLGDNNGLDCDSDGTINFCFFFSFFNDDFPKE